MTQFKRLALLSVLAACSKGGGGKSASIDMFGKKPVPPGDLAKIKPGMTQAQVKALFPGIGPTPNHSGSPSLRIPSGYSDAQYDIVFYSDRDAVADIDVDVPKAVGAKLEQAWGAPTDKGMFPKWVNDDDGYEASLQEMGRKSTVEFRPFTPLSAAFFGSKPGPIDVLTKVKLGMTRDEIAKAAPGFETAGAPGGNGSFVPYEAAAKDVRIEIDYSADNKAEQFQVTLPAKGGDIVTKAWGPRPGKARGTDTPMQCWDLADGTRVELQDNRLTYTTPDHSFCEVQ
jgi:hypothetical protein